MVHAPWLVDVNIIIWQHFIMASNLLILVHACELPTYNVNLKKGFDNKKLSDKGISVCGSGIVDVAC